jgi:hypothetical protein
MRGRIAMTSRFISFGIWPVGSVLGGVLGTVFDVKTALFILAGGNAISGIWLFIGPLKRSKDFPAEPAASP